MRTIATLVLLFALTTISCRKKTNEMVPNHSDSIIIHDSILSGEFPVTPDSADTILPVDSTSYDVDSIKRSR